MLAGAPRAVEHLVQRLRKDRTAQILILALLVANLVCLAVFVWLFILTRPGTRFWTREAFDLAHDGSVPELLNYLQALACAALLGGIFARTRHPVYVAWMMIFLFVAVDDALLLHERIGRYLAGAIDLPSLGRLRSKDLGELLVWAVAGCALLGILLAALRRSDPVALGFSGVFALLFAGLVGFAVGVDMIHAAFSSNSPRREGLFKLVEGGGEMGFVALSAASALLLYRLPRAELAERPDIEPDHRSRSAL